MATNATKAVDPSLHRAWLNELSKLSRLKGGTRRGSHGLCRLGSGDEVQWEKDKVDS